MEIEVFSAKPFPVRDALTVLRVADSQFELSHYPRGDLNTLIFSLTAEQFGALRSGDAARVSNLR